MNDEKIEIIESQGVKFKKVISPDGRETVTLENSEILPSPPKKDKSNN